MHKLFKLFARENTRILIIVTLLAGMLIGGVNGYDPIMLLRYMLAKNLLPQPFSESVSSLKNRKLIIILQLRHSKSCERFHLMVLSWIFPRSVLGRKK
jgi:hypothetical protein